MCVVSNLLLLPHYMHTCKYATSAPWFALPVGMLSVYWLNNFHVSDHVTLLTFAVITIDCQCPLNEHLISFLFSNDDVEEKARREEIHYLKLGNRNSGYVLDLTLVAVAEVIEDNSKKKWNEKRSVCSTHVCCNIYHRLLWGTSGREVTWSERSAVGSFTDPLIPVLIFVPGWRELSGDTSFNWRQRRSTERK